LVWATTWIADANQYIAPHLGLPELTVVIWPEASAAEEEQDERQGLHWKTRTLVRWAAGRTFAWADDEITSTDRAWVAMHHPGQALLHRVDPTKASPTATTSSSASGRTRSASDTNPATDP
jgi:hypothetical protein